MYWHNHNLYSKSMLRSYARTAFVVCSVASNMFLYTMLQSHATRIPPELPRSAEQMAREITIRLFDTSYVSYAANTNALVTGKDLTAQLIGSLQKQGLLPATASEITATARTLAVRKFVAAVRIDSIVVAETLTDKHFIPVDVKGVVATHSAGGANEFPFRLRFLFGEVASAARDYHSKQNATLVVTDIQEFTP